MRKRNVIKITFLAILQPSAHVGNPSFSEGYKLKQTNCLSQAHQKIYQQERE